MSEANLVTLKYLAEAAPLFHTANSPNWKYLPYTSMSLSHVPNTVISNEIGDGTEQVQDLVCVGETNGGDVGFELSVDLYNAIFKACFQGKQYGTPPYRLVGLRTEPNIETFVFEIGYEDFAVPHYLKFEGCRISRLNLNFAYGEIVTGSFGIMAQRATEGTTSFVGTGSVADVPFPRKVFDVACGESQIRVNDSKRVGKVKNLSMSLDNQLRPMEGIGHQGARGFSAGRANVTGTMTVYFDDIEHYRNLLEANSFDISMTVKTGEEVGDQTMFFNIPRAKLTDGSPVVSGADTDVMLTLNFTGLYDGVNSKQAFRFVEDVIS